MQGFFQPLALRWCRTGAHVSTDKEEGVQTRHFQCLPGAGMCDGYSTGGITVAVV